MGIKTRFLRLWPVALPIFWREIGYQISKSSLPRRPEPAGPRPLATALTAMAEALRPWVQRPLVPIAALVARHADVRSAHPLATLLYDLRFPPPPTAPLALLSPAVDGQRCPPDDASSNHVANAPVRGLPLRPGNPTAIALARDVKPASGASDSRPAAHTYP